MSAHALIGIASFVLMTGSFYFVRPSVFLAVALGILALSAMASWQVAAGAHTVIMLLGLALYGFGLLIVRIMLRRSVSLHLLSRYASGDAAASVRTDIASRLQDAEHHGLVTRSDDVYTLTRFGRCIVWLTGVLRVAIRAAS